MKTLLFFLGLCITTFTLNAATAFKTDIPLLKEEHLKSAFWINQLQDGNSLLLNENDIHERNEQTYKVQAQLSKLAEEPAFYSKQQLTDIIQKVSAIPTSARFYRDKTPLNNAHWQYYLSLLSLDTLLPKNNVQFALVTKRTALRAFPTTDRVFNEEGNTDLDRFSETALFVADPVAVLHQSADKAWLLVKSFNYTGWVKAGDIAIGDKDTVLGFGAKTPFVVITGAKVKTAFNPDIQAISELPLDMGVRLPKLDASNVGFNVNGQNPVASYIVELPKRDEHGKLTFSAALIPRHEDINQGYLAFTPNNIISQAFKFLGERYGWGHDYNGRDCTGFISEIFRSFGFVMPRNSGQQGNGAFGFNIRFDKQSSDDEKLAAIANAKVGDLLYFPGHVSLYLGMVDNQPFMIHDVNSLIYPKTNGQLYIGTINGVAVTPLLPMNSSKEQTYLQALYAIKSLR